MNRLQEIRVEAVKEKASAILGWKKSKIKEVIEDYQGAMVIHRNGQQRIPYEVWVLGMSESDYIASL